MQLQWAPKLAEPLRQLEEWTYPYTRYQGQYEYFISGDTPLGVTEAKINTLWSNTLPKLLLADSDEAFDRILADYVTERDALGYAELAAEKTRQLTVNKQRLNME